MKFTSNYTVDRKAFLAKPQLIMQSFRKHIGAEISLRVIKPDHIIVEDEELLYKKLSIQLGIYHASDIDRVLELTAELPVGKEIRRILTRDVL